MEIFLLVLPWLWIAVAVFILARPARRARRPAAATAFAVVLAAYGMSDFFVTPHGRPPLWLAAWKAACILALAGILAGARRPAGGEKR
jgi:hypothetical protein